MIRRAPSALFATVLLLAQLLFGVMTAGASPHSTSQHCGGCPGGQTSDLANSLSHDMGGGASDCGTHCSQHGSHDTGHGSCGTGCAMAGSSHCGFSVSPALPAASSFQLVVVPDAFRVERHDPAPPDSPLFDFLRPPTRG